MDSWSFNSEVKGFADDESLSTAGAFDKDQFGSIGLEIKPPFMGLFPNENNFENQLFRDIGFPPLMRNSLAMVASQNAFSEDYVSSSNLESNSRESELFDLKLGRITDQRDAQILKGSKISHSLSQTEVSKPSKRPREGGFGSSTPFCKVHGCNKNLINCKEYHKRHKVCEVHSKTSKVIVNGIEQRFCQQCSRFHVLCEFDDGKRSCRKRLAGHNERRRKPHAGVLSQPHGSLSCLFPSNNMSRGYFVISSEKEGSTGTISSFRVPNELCITYEQMHSKSLCPLNLERKSRSDGYIEASTSVSTGLSGIASNSGSALSLLSFQSQSSTSCHSSRIQTSNSQSHSMWFLGCHCEPTQDSRPLRQHDMNPSVGFEN